MRYSRGNRGNPGRQWAERTHEMIVRKKAPRFPLRCKGTTTFAQGDPYWYGAPEKLRLDWICQNCGAKYMGSVSTLARCLCCGLEIANMQDPT